MRLVWTTMLSAIAGLLSGCTLGHAASPPAVESPTDRVSVNSARDSSAPMPGVATIVVHPATQGPAISNTILGANSTVSFDTSIPGQAAAFKSAGLRAGRWPGGSNSDQYNWQTNTGCTGKGYVWKSATFDNFMGQIATPAGLDVEVTVNYGTANQPACNAPGSPALAGAWVEYANKTHAYHIKWWEVGNEVYGSWETDMHAAAHDAATYATSFAAYAQQMKAQDPTIHVGVPISPGALDDASRNWDTYVLAHTAFDYVDYHFYAQAPNAENDQYLVQTAPAVFAATLATIKTELAAANKPNAPIDIGEIGSDYNIPGKQAASITQALYAAQIIGEMMNAGVTRATWWLANGGCAQTGNMATSLYGWQDFGGYAIFSDGLPTPWYGGCQHVKETIPFGTLLPTARTYELLSESGMVTSGQHTLGVTVPAELSTVRAYAATTSTGYAVMLVNLSEAASTGLSLAVDALPGGSKYATYTYGKAQYDQSQHGVWAGPVQTVHGQWAGPIVAMLPPYSISVISVTR